MLPLNDKVVTLEKEHTQVQNRLLKAEQKCKSLEEKLISLETSSGRNNLKLLNVKDTDTTSYEREDCEQIFIDLCNQLGINIGEQDIERIYRVGPTTNKDRPMIVKFNHFKARQKIFQQRVTFRTAGVIVVEDFPAEVVNRRRRLIPAHKNPQKFKARLLIDKLLLNNKLYSTDDLDDIPEELRPCNLSTVQNGHMVAFFTCDSKFSNHFPCLFEHDGLQFSSVEQFLMFQKAKHFGDDSIAKEIMKTDDPAITKALGRKVKHFKLEDWKKVCDEYMRNGI